MCVCVSVCLCVCVCKLMRIKCKSLIVYHSNILYLHYFKMIYRVFINKYTHFKQTTIRLIQYMCSVCIGPTL